MSEIAGTISFIRDILDVMNYENILGLPLFTHQNVMHWILPIDPIIIQFKFESIVIPFTNTLFPEHRFIYMRVILVHDPLSLIVEVISKTRNENFFQGSRPTLLALRHQHSVKF